MAVSPILFSFILLFLGSLSSEKEIYRWTRFSSAGGMGTDTKSTAPISWDDSDYLWRTDLPGTGHGSPVVWEDKIFVTSSDNKLDQGFLVAVNEKSGELGWELDRENAVNNSFSTPNLVQGADFGSQLLFTSEAHGFTALDPQSGEVLWERKSLLTQRVVASPVYANERIVACRKGETVVLEVDENIVPVADTALYRLPPNLSPYVPTPIVVGEQLYLFLDNGSVACLELSDGELLWKERPAGPIYGSPICVNGNLYCITKAGSVIVLKAQASYELLGIIELGDESFSTPAMSTSGMVFRTFTKLMMLGNQSLNHQQ